MPSPNPIAFSIFGQNIYWYGILIAAAVLLGILLCMKRAPMYDTNADTVVDIALIIIPSALVGARLYYVLFSWAEFASDPLRILRVWEGGLAFYGGLIGAVVAAAICVKVKKLHFIKLLDMAAPAVALGQAIGRWGNFINQEAYGEVVTNPALQFFPIAVFIQAEGSWHMATFFYESISCLLIGLFLLWYAKRRPRDGNVALMYVLLYGLERSIVEGFRMDSLYLGPFRVSQLLSILMVAAALLLLAYRFKKKRDSIVEIDPNLVMRRRIDEEDAMTGAAEADDGGQDVAAQQGEQPKADGAGADSPAEEEEER